jgi:hypothetical protein
MQQTECYNVISAATEVVEVKLEVLEALCEANKYRIEEGSRLICRCLTCRGENSSLHGWLWDMRQPEPGDSRRALSREIARARAN